MIPALTALGEHTEAVDQYIEVINRFPEDEDLLREAAWYADQHSLRARLTDAYVKTTTESPRDARYHVVLARLHAQLEDPDLFRRDPATFQTIMERLTALETALPAAYARWEELEQRQ